MKNFEIIFNEVWPARPVRVIVGDTETYLGIYCEGLSELKDGQVEWLNSHKPIRISYSAKEVKITYRKNWNYTKIVWG